MSKKMSNSEKTRYRADWIGVLPDWINEVDLKTDPELLAEVKRVQRRRMKAARLAYAEAICNCSELGVQQMTDDDFSEEGHLEAEALESRVAEAQTNYIAAKDALEDVHVDFGLLPNDGTRTFAEAVAGVGVTPPVKRIGAAS